jgi:hypothetical protein
MRSARLVAALVLLTTGPALAACARGAATSRDSLLRWESSYVPASPCRPSVQRGAVRGGEADRAGTLVVRLTDFRSPALVDHTAIVVAPLAPLDTLAQPVVRREDATARPAPFELPLRPGRYLLDARAFGYEKRTDTVDVRPGASDTVTVALEEYGNALRNQHNCRPRGFRRAGERACITDQITTVVVLDRARDMAAPRFRFGVGLPAGDSTNVRIVDDERICERAARVYGLDTGPPRRVVVVDAAGFLVVYDPAEPVAFGEYNQWLLIDRRFRVLARLVL